MTAYYNEIDAYAAQWLRNLIMAGLIAPGDVDDRSIKDVQATDLRGYRQCHFFAGIGVWSHALRLAGWSDDREVWTGSCPCQPFSVAGAQRGTADERHLWPEFFRLIREFRPSVVVGEQVSGPAALAWFDALSTDLEGAGYAVGAADLCAASTGSPHIRQRLYWMGYTSQPGGGRYGGAVLGAQTEGDGERGETRCLANESFFASSTCRLADSDELQSGYRELQRGRRLVQLAQNPLAGFWRDADWIACTDGRARPVESGTFPLAHWVAGRVGKLRAYGNSLCAPVAEAFVRSVMECLP